MESVEISIYAGKDSAGVSIFSQFSIHCVLSYFSPRVGRWTTVTADAVGTYTVKGHASLCVMVSYFNNADSPGKGRACGKNVFPEDDDSSVVLSCQLII